MSDQTTGQIVDLPNWLTTDLLQNTLRDHFKNDAIVVQQFLTNQALAKGENFSSVLLRIRVKFTSGSNDLSEIKLIVKKKLPSDSELAGVIGDFDCFGIEINTYRNVLPKVHELLRSIGDDTLLAPKCLAADKTNGFLIFEDLSDDAFYMIDRRAGIDVEHYRPALNQLAKWHATTLCILEKDPLIGKQFHPARYSDVSPWRVFNEMAISSLADYCALHPQFEHIGRKLNGRASIIYDRINARCQIKSDGFSSLCHGDMWSNNILFRKSKSEIDAKFVDFQHVYNGSPCLDLLRVLYGNSHEDLDIIDWDELVQYYHSVYAITLKKLGFPEHRIPSLTTLHVQMLELCESEAFIILFVPAFRQLPEMDEDPVAHFFNTEPESRKFLLDSLLNPESAKSVQKLIKYFDRKGVFD